MANPEPVSALQALVEKWRQRARTDAKYGVSQALESKREYYGTVNAAFAISECADELAGVLSQVEAPHPAAGTGGSIEVQRLVRMVETCGLLKSTGHLCEGCVGEIEWLAALLTRRDQPEQQEELDARLLAWAVVNCHMLARRALARTTSVYDREKWEHVLRICEKAGARSQGVLRASVPTKITDGSEAATRRDAPQEPERILLESLKDFLEAIIAQHGCNDHAWLTRCAIDNLKELKDLGRDADPAKEPEPQ